MDKDIQKAFEDLAVMVAKGFEQTATKDELTTTKDELKQDIAALNVRFDTLERKVDRQDLRHDKTRDLVIDLENGPITDLQRRMYTVEKTLKVSVK